MTSGWCALVCCGEAATGLCASRYGGESICDWVGADLVENGSGAKMGTATQLFVKNVNAKKILVACSNERSKRKFGAEGTKDVLVSVCRCTWQSELK